MAHGRRKHREYPESPYGTEQFHTVLSFKRRQMDEGGQPADRKEGRRTGKDDRLRPKAESRQFPGGGRQRRERGRTEYAYFRADVRKCFEYPLDINGNSYYFASVGEKEEILEWTRRNHEDWNKMNYTRTLYIERDNTTLDYFKRFKVVQIPNIDGNLESWEVQAVNHNAVDDILIVHVKEYFENQYQEVSDEEQEKIEQEHQLEGDFVCHAYDKIKFVADYIENAEWEIRNKTDGLYPKINDAIVKNEKTTLYIQLMNSKTGEFDVYYNNQLINHVVVEPF